MRTARHSTLLGLTLALTGGLSAQSGHDALASLNRASHVIIPQQRAFATRTDVPPVEVEAVRAHVNILEQTARTALEIRLRNPGTRPAEAILLLPVPANAAISEFVFEGESHGATAQLLVRDEARQLYDSIVAKLRDPALLEFAGYNLIRSSLFPIAPGGTQRIHLTYEHLLEGDGARIDYALPRSESLQPSAPWTIQAEIRTSAHPISTVYSPSHEIFSRRITPRQHKIRTAEAQVREPGPFLLSFLIDRGNQVTASLFTYPNPKIGGGYFLLLAGLPARDAAARDGLQREVTLVLDRSGSMAGAKMEQAMAAARQVIEGLADGESFNIVDYSTAVATFAAAPVEKNSETTKQARAYLAGLRPGGGTNIHDALVEALRPAPRPGTLPIVLFLTDGLPTVGKTSEVQIRAAAERGNPHQRRIFTFGVGHDVNVPLLDWLADATRATTTYVQPNEDVEVKVSQVFTKLYGPVLADTQLRTHDAHGAVDTRRIREQLPTQLPDLFENDRLVVLGQYRGTEPLRFQLAGNYLGKARTFRFVFPLDLPTTRNAFVPRLWASRQIAHLIDQIRQAGAAHATTAWTVGANPFEDPRLVEIRDEILRLSTEFGILSEYTAFLATEGTQLGDWHGMVVTCSNELEGKAVRTRSGIGAVNQGANITWGKAQSVLNRRNYYLDDKLDRVEIATVQQMHDRAFFRRGKRWVDGRAILDGKLEADTTIMFGAPEHLELLRRLVRDKRSGILSLSGEILIRLDGQNVLVVNDDC